MSRNRKATSAKSILLEWQRVWYDEFRAAEEFVVIPALLVGMFSILIDTKTDKVQSSLTLERTIQQIQAKIGGRQSAAFVCPSVGRPVPFIKDIRQISYHF